MRHVLLVGLVAASAGAARAQAPQAPPPAPTPSTAHPWYAKPEHGGWFILIKGYAGPDSQQMAERLAQDIRDTYKAPAYLFERGAEERKKEKERVAKEAARKKAEQQAEFLKLTEKLRAEAMAKGWDFAETAPRVFVPTVRIEEQWAVFVGGWPTMEAARKQLDAIRQWPAPKDVRLLDSASTSDRTTGRQAHLNPFHTAFVVPNPAAPKTLSADAQADPLVLRMNEAEELSVLKIQKPWTIVVKSFFAPMQDLKDKSNEGPNVFRKVFGAKQQDALSATAHDARKFADALREMKPRPLEAYVLHSYSGSLVCVGQFDAPDAPPLVAEQQHLESLTFDVRETKDGPVKERRKMFDRLVAMKVR